MTAPRLETTFPLAWPEGRPRTPENDRRMARFNSAGLQLSFPMARKRLIDEVKRITPPGRLWRVDELQLTSEVRVTASGALNRNYRAEPDDPGVAFYFALDGHPHVLACDKWDRVADNIAAIAAHIEALRGQERWGVADLAQAFAGHQALPPPDPWHRVLGVPADAPWTAIASAYRELARKHHPDAGGNRAEWDRLTDAYEAAKRARS